MRLLINLGTTLPDLPRDIRTLAAVIANDFEWFYRIARETIGFGQQRVETRYNDRTVEKLYRPGTLIRVIQHTHLHGVLSKLNSKYSGFCKVLEIRKQSLTLLELDF